jgi:hypothetical protein
MAIRKGTDDPTGRWHLEPALRGQTERSGVRDGGAVGEIGPRRQSLVGEFGVRGQRIR